jgi:rubrerythrin
MSIFFSGGEILEMAMGIERNGIIFYDTLANKTADKDVCSLFRYLSDEEKKHLMSFRNMSGSEGNYVPAESYPGEYMQYLKLLIDSAVFLDITDARRQAENAISDYNAINIGIQAEKDSILFYSELRTIVSVPDRDIVDTIIEAEKDHLRQLSELRVIMVDKGGDNGGK